MLLYNNKGRIVGYGNVTENSTHYILESTYYDKSTCNLADVILPDDFDKDYYEYIDSKLLKVKSKLITRNQFNNLLGREAIKNLIIASKTDVDIETFKFFLEACVNGIDLQDQNLIDGMNYLLYKGYITQEIYNNVMN